MARSNEQMLPQNQEAEQLVLGTVIIEGSEALNQVEVILPGDFYNESHQKIFNAMLEMQRENRPIDVFTLFDYMKSQGQLLEDVGGSSYLTYLTGIVPSTANVGYYAELVKEKALLRECAKLGFEIYDSATTEATYDNLTQKFTSRWEKLSTQSVGCSVPFISSDVLIAQGADSLEWYVDGLIPKGGLVLITAPPGLYKTWLALHIGLAIAKGETCLGRESRKATVYYIDKENPKPLIRQRLNKLGADENLKLWGYWSKIEPPNIDVRLASYKAIAKDNSVLIFDSLIRFHSGDENSSQDMSRVMGNLRSLTREGATGVILHHKGKSEFSYRGSSDILGAVDICYTLEKEGENLLKLSCRTKNRLTKEFDLFIQIEETEGSLSFDLADSPKHVEEEADLERMKLIIQGIAESGLEPIQSKILEEAEKIGFSKDKSLKLLGKGEGKIWSKEPGSTHNKKVYKLLNGSFPVFGDIYTSENSKTETDPWDVEESEEPEQT